MNLKKVINEFKKIYGVKPSCIISAPGRLDFLNTHQDYKGLPVVSIAVNLRAYIAISPSHKNFEVISWNYLFEGKEYRDEFDFGDPLRNNHWFGNYFRAAVKALAKRVKRLNKTRALVVSDIPIASGLGSSAAITVSYVAANLHLNKELYTHKYVAEIAYEAEHDIMNIPCGRLDQYGSTFGGVIKINTRPPFDVERLPEINGLFVVLDSGIRHNTREIHSNIINKLRIAISSLRDIVAEQHIKKALTYDVSSIRWELINEQELLQYLSTMPEELANLIIYTLRANRSTELAIRVLKGAKLRYNEIKSYLPQIETMTKKERRSENNNLELIGAIMNYQHELLRDLYKVSLPELEQIRNSAIDAGALGVKITGAGMGGSLIALVKDMKTARRVLRASIEAGALRGWIVRVDEGLKSH